MTVRTDCPTYIPPSLEEMRRAAATVGLNNFAPDLVEDIANIAAGGHINPPSSYREQVQQQIIRNMPLPDKRGHFTYGKGEKTDSFQKAVEERTADAMRYHANVCDFLKTLSLESVPGHSPLAKAMSTLKLLAAADTNHSYGNSSGQLPVFTTGKPEKVAQTINETMEKVVSLSKEEREILEDKDGDQELRDLELAENLLPGSKNRIILEISRKLDDMTVLQTYRRSTVTVDPDGHEVRRRPINDMSEIGRIAPQELHLRRHERKLFLYKAIARQFTVRERITRTDRKQIIFILLDGSGSMMGGKHHRATGVVMNRLKAVLTDDAEVWLAVFDDKLGHVHQATTPDEARAVIKVIMKQNFSGGGTNIANAIRGAKKFIDKRMASGEALCKPEIVVLTDEDESSSDLNPAELDDIKVHGFCMESTNPSLKKLAQQTGGICVENF